MAAMSKDTKKKRTREKLAAYCELTLLFLLTAALIVMFTQYCLLKNRGHYGGLPLLDAMHSNFSDYSDTVGEKKTSFLTPSFIGVFSDGKKVAPKDFETREELVRDSRPFILALFGGNAFSSRPEFSSDAAKEAYLERELYGNANAVYITFPDEIPAAAIYPLLTGKSFGEEKEAYGVRELFIFCGDGGTVGGAALDRDGELTVLTVSDRTTLSFDTFSAYLGKEGMTEFSFARLENTARRYAVLNSSVTTPNLAAYNASGDFLTQGSGDVETILGSFGFNVNSTRFFVTRNSYITYVEDSGELRISSEGNITYTGISGGGIPVSTLCARQTATGSFSDKVCAAYTVLQSLNPTQYGGCADFCMTSASYKDGKLTLNFSYVTNGVSIDDVRDAASFTFGENALLSATVSCRTFMLLESTFGDIPGRLLFAVTAAEQSEADGIPIAFSPVYTRDEPEAAYTARYAFLFAQGADTVNRDENGNKNESTDGINTGDAENTENAASAVSAVNAANGRNGGNGA